MLGNYYWFFVQNANIIRELAFSKHYLGLKTFPDHKIKNLGNFLIISLPKTHKGSVLVGRATIPKGRDAAASRGAVDELLLYTATEVP